MINLVPCPACKHINYLEAGALALHLELVKHPLTSLNNPWLESDHPISGTQVDSCEQE